MEEGMKGGREGGREREQVARPTVVTLCAV